MFNRHLRRARPITREAIAINDLARSVSGNRDMRPVGTLCNYIDTPWGQANVPGRADWTIAFTTSEVPAAVQNDDGTLTLGAGTAYEAYPAIDPDTGAITLSYANSVGNQFPVYNIAKNSDAAVVSGRWIIAQKFWSLWIVTWEECPDS